MFADPTDPVSIAFQRAILAGDLNAIRVLVEYFDDPRILAAAFRFSPDRRDELLAESSNRRNDPDVIAVRVLAKTMLDLRDSTKLADVILFAIESPDGTVPVNRTELNENIVEAFNNRTLSEEVLYTDPNLPDEDKRRRLLVAGSPVDSLYCANCYKKALCKKTTYWC